jgi:hypothetical protein
MRFAPDKPIGRGGDGSTGMPRRAVWMMVVLAGLLGFAVGFLAMR